MPLLPVLLGAVIAALASQLAGGAERPAAVGLAGTLGLALAGLGLSYALARSAVARIVRERARPATMRRYAILGKALWILLLLAYWLVLDEGGVEAFARPRGPEVAAVSLAGPWVLACFALWTGTFLGERRALRGSARLRDELRSKARRVLVPAGAFGAVALVLNRVTSLEGVRETFDLYPHARPIAFGLGVLSIFTGGSLVLRALSPSVPLETFGASLPSWLGPIAKKIRYREWDLGFPIATAAIAGLLGRGRTVFVTRALRESLDARELGAVVAHEVGHAALGHLTARAAFALSLVLVLDDMAAALERAFPDDVVTPLAVIGSAIAVVTLGFVLLARRLEHDADLFAAERAGGELVVAALAKACGANGASPESGGLLHPSPRARIELVRRAASEPGLVPRRLARSRALVGLVVVLALAAVGLVGWGLLGDVRRPARERLVRAAQARLESGEPDLARSYADRALSSGDDARALLVRARTRPGSERDLALTDLGRASELGPDLPTAAAIERARIDLSAAH